MLFENGTVLDERRRVPVHCTCSLFLFTVPVASTSSQIREIRSLQPLGRGLVDEMTTYRARSRSKTS